MTTEPPPTTDRSAWSKAVPLLVLAGLLAYANSFTKAFVLDDIIWIVNNPDIADASRYLTLGDRPVVKASVLLNYWFGKLNPPGYHAFNLAVHVLAGLTLYGLVRRVLLLPRFAGRYDAGAPYLAFAVALLWLVHPLQTMAVTYVIQRSESMMGLFYLFAFYAWLRGATGGARGVADPPHPAASRLWYAAALASFALSMGCKQVAVTLPPVLLAFDRVFLARSWRELFRERRLPWAALFVTWLVIAVRPAVQGAFLTDTSTGIGFTITAVTPTQYLFTQSEVILHYVRLSVLPLHQALDYIDWPIAHSVRDVLPAFLAVSALLAGSLALLYFRPVAGFVGFWFFAILAPTSSLMPIIDPVFEQRMYLPLISVVVAAVFGAHALIARTGWPEHTKARAGAAALGVTAVVLTALTVLRNETYRSEMVAWQTAAKARPNNARAWMSVGAMYLNAGDLKGASEALKIAQEHADPTNFTFQATLAGYWAAAGDLEKAEGIYAGLAKVPYNPFVSPRVYKNLAWILLARGKPDEAAAWLRKLIEYQPHVADNYLNLAAAELAAGHETEAREAAKKAAELNPALPQLAAAQARANVLVPEGGALAFRKPQALWVAAAACLADGDRDPQMLDTLAMAYAWHERYPEAADAARRGLAAARAKGDEDWTAALEARLKLYEAGKPYTKPIPPK